MDGGLLPSLVEYARAQWGVNHEARRAAQASAVVMHRARSATAASSCRRPSRTPARSVILDQVANGVAVRCAVLKRCWQAWKEAA